MRLSTSTNICAFRPDGRKNELGYCIEKCAQGGYTVLDVNFCEAMNPSSRLRSDDWETYVEELASIGRGFGIEFTQSHLPYYDIFGPNSDDKTLLMEELIRRSIIASGMLGVKWAVTHPGTVYTAGHDAHASLEQNLIYYRRHLKTAVEAGVGIALENDFEYRSAPYQRIFAASVEELCALCDAFSSSHMGICYDFGHANLTGGFHRQNLALIGKRLKAVHVQDNDGTKDQHLMPFFGEINWAEAMEGLAECGYDGDLTYEIQEFGRFVPNELKHTVVDLSITIGNQLISMYRQAQMTL